jgi:hypothetical protein
LKLPSSLISFRLRFPSYDVTRRRDKPPWQDWFSFCLPERRAWQAKAIALRHGRRAMSSYSRESGMKLLGYDLSIESSEKYAFVGWTKIFLS